MNFVLDTIQRWSRLGCFTEDLAAFKGHLRSEQVADMSTKLEKENPIGSNVQCTEVSYVYVSNSRRDRQHCCIRIASNV